MRGEGATSRILLIRRARPPRAGEWSVPGGRIEPGERPGAAALRELREETGILATLGPLVEVVDAVFEGRAYRLHDYLCAWRAGEPCAGDDALEARWFTLAEARELGMWAKTLEIVERALEA